MAKSNIEWTDETWNPFTGCTKISPGCKNCYAERQANWLKGIGQKKYMNGFDFTHHPETYDMPLKKTKPRKFFVNSMSDLFHESAHLEEIKKVFDVMNKSYQHIFQVLTKRPERIQEIYFHLKWTQNIWLGVSVENEDFQSRIDQLREVPATIRFLSIEPMLGPIPNLNLKHIHWVICGGESGPNCRPIEKDWVRDIRDQCGEANVPFFFKQWGGEHKKEHGKMLDGREWKQFPENSYVYDWNKVVSEANEQDREPENA